MEKISAAELKERLAFILEWDPLVVEGVIEAIDATDDLHECQEISLSFMGDSPEAIALVEQYCTTKRAAADASNPQHYANSTTSTSHPQNGDTHPLGKENGAKMMHAQTRDDKAQRSHGKNQKGKKNMNKVDSSEGKKLPSEVMQRKVVNCLGCGKIYDSRKLSEELYQFVESGGICLFCGTKVDLAYSGSKTETTEVQKAVEFKDRLVDYDRNSAQRTTVLDDQSDYFEIETNVWLDEKEKKELRQRKELEEHLAKEQKSKVHYTIDLLGRKVYISENQPLSDEAKQLAEAATQAAESTSAELPQGGGTGAKDATQMASKLLQSKAKYKFRVQSNPDVSIAAPIFLPSKKALVASKKNKEAAPPAWIQGSGGRLQHDDVFAAFDENFEPEVLSSDLSAYSELFEDWDNSVFDLCPETKPEELQNYDTSQEVSNSLSANTRLSTMLVPDPDSNICISSGPELPHLSAGDKMPDGIVLLKNWLSFEEQIRIVETVRNLGIGEGGFYTPGYGTDIKLKLKMMCLGMNWNPVNRTYEKHRSNFDGAVAPLIPDFLHTLVQRCMQDANRLRSRPFSSIDPNICLCNFYAKDSLLGLHQDREEGLESLKRQIPVVSFSIGATGEFVFNKVRSMDTAKSILLESGDAMLFGGPSRMIFHGIRKVYPESMPQELAEYTGMRTGRLNLTIRQYIPDKQTS